MIFNNNRHIPPILALLLLAACFFVSCQKDARVEGILTKAETLLKTHPDSALALLQTIENPQGLAKSQRAAYNLLLVQSKEGNSLDISGDTTALQESADYFVHKHDLPNAALAYYWQSRAYQQSDNREAAVKSCLNAIEYNDGKDKRLSGLIFHEMGRLYQQQGNFNEAMKNYQQSQQYFADAGDKVRAGYAHKYIGTAYLYMAPQQPDSAIVSYRRALDCAMSIRDTFEIAVLHKNISLAYGEKRDVLNEKAYMLEALKYSKDDDILAIVQRMLAEIYANENRADSAAYYMNGLMANPAGNSLLDDRYYNHIMLYQMYKKFGDYSSALAHYEKSRVLLDSIQRYKVDQSVLEIQKKYDKEALENRYSKVLVQRLVLTVGIIVIILLSVIAGYFFMLKMKNRKIELLVARESLGTMTRMLSDRENQQRELASSLEEKEKMLSASRVQQETLTSTLEENRERLRAILMEKLNIAQKVAQLNIVPTDNDDVFMKRYQKVFGKNLMDELDWENLYALINDLYNGFADKIKAKYPDIADKDLQLCCFIRAGFQPEEMAVLLNYTQNTIRVKKSRLAQKMGFADYDSFLSAIMDM